METQPQAARQGWGFAKELMAALGVLAVVAALGWPLGRLWAEVAPRVPVRKVDGSLYYGTPEPEQIMAGDGWFAVLGAGTGFALAVLAWVLLRRGRGPWQVGALVLGSLASATIAYYVGHRIGANAFEALRDSTPDGEIFPGPLELNITRQKAGKLWPARPDGVLALQAGAAALTYTCLAGWSRFASLRGPDPAPRWDAYPGYPAADPTTPPIEEPQFGPGRIGRSDNDAGTART